jgi:hypothetical protein
MPVERLVLQIILCLSVVDISLIYWKSMSVDIPGYFFCIASGVFLFAIGQYYRLSGRDLQLGGALTASGIFILFSLAASIFNYMFLPIAFAPIDTVLMRVDATVGYSWPDVVGWAATYPLVGRLLFVVYMTSLPQLLVIVITLGFTGQEKMLNRFILTGVIGALASILVWIFFPTFGAKAYHDLPAWVSSAIPLAVDPAYGDELLRLGQEGVAHLSPKDVLGLIGFPSFHIFMALMSVVFVPRHILFVVCFGTLNALMLPAVLVQGGHHLSDVFGGFAMFAIVCPASCYIVDKISHQDMPVAEPQPA